MKQPRTGPAISFKEQSPWHHVAALCAQGLDQRTRLLCTGLPTQSRWLGSPLPGIAFLHCNQPSFSPLEFLEFSKETVIAGNAWAIPGSEIHMEGGGR